MIQSSALQLVNGALKLLNVLAAGEIANANDTEDGFRRLNALIDSWGTQRQTMYAHQRTVLQLLANQQTYTIGPSIGANFIQPRPLAIDNAAILLPGSSPPTEIPIAPLTDDAYAAIAIKTLSNPLITQYFYELGSPDGSLFVWPLPDQDLQLVIYWYQEVAQFPNLTALVSLGAGYERALRYNLALELAPEFGVFQLHPLTVQHAADALADIKRINLGLNDLALDPALTGQQARPYNIFTDQ